MAFNRFLALMFSQGPKAAFPWVLKGGYAMELQTDTGQTTPGVPSTPDDQCPDVAAFIEEVGDTKLEVRARKPQSFIYPSGLASPVGIGLSRASDRYGNQDAL
jgi:hypothetical protein